MMLSFLGGLAIAAAQLAHARYTFPDFIAGSTVTTDWQYVRMTDNHYSQAPVTDVTSPLMKCYETNTASSTSTYTVAAGSTIGFKADQAVYHPGYLDIYMALATPTANTESAGSGAVWFKVYEEVPTYSKSTGLTFPPQKQTFTFTIPKSLPSGQYLVRIEQIALHVASTYGGAQLYIACAQINVTGGGNGNPGPKVAFPGAYTGYEPGILINIYNLPANYTGYTAQTMEGKALAIDSSIWIYQFQATMRDKEGRGLVNAHILGFLRRICKLLYYGIKPVFVFDGGAPALKRTTLADRRKKKSGAAESHVRVAERLLAAQLRREALNQAAKAKARKGRQQDPDKEPEVSIDDDAVYLEDLEPNAPARTPQKSSTQGPTELGNKDPSPAKSDKVAQDKARKKKWQNHDPYHLPELDFEEAVTKATSSAAPDPRLATEEELQAFIDEMRPEDFDVQSEAFRELPTELQYEIIGDLRLKSRQTSYKRLQAMLRSSETPLDFSKAQIQNLQKRNALTQQLLVTTNMVSRANLTIPIRVASERNREYILVKNDDATGGWVLGVRDEGTKEKPITVDTKSDGEEEQSPRASKVATRHVSPDPDLREFKQHMALSAIGIRRSPKKPVPAPPKPARRSPAKRLFHADEDDTQPLDGSVDELPESDEDDPAVLVAIQKSLNDVEAIELQKAIEASKVSRMSGYWSGTGEGGDPGPSTLKARTTASNLYEDMGVITGEGSPLLAAHTNTNASATSSGANVEPLMNKIAAASMLFGLPTLLLEDEPSLPPPTGADNSGPEVNVATDDSDDLSMEEVVPNSIPASKGTQSNAMSLIDSDSDEMEEVVQPAMPLPLNPPLDDTMMLVESDGASSPEARSQSPIVLSRTIKSPDAARPAVVPLGGAPKSEKPFPSTPSSNPPPIARDDQSQVNHELRPQHSDSKRPSTSAPPWFSENHESQSVPSAVSSLVHSMTDELTPAQPLSMTETAITRDVTSGLSDEEYFVTDWSKSPSPEHSDREHQGDEKSTRDIKVPEKVTKDFDAADELDLHAEEGEFARFISQVKGQDLESARKEVDAEIQALLKEKKVAMRDSEDVTQQMVGQIKVLLRLFGIPYVTAPMEAEAQCAALAEFGLVDGIITDDSDIFLFGGLRVFRNMFNQSKTVECFLLADMSRELGLDREKLIRLAYLLGSDYVDGLPGVGPVVAMEILKEFSEGDSLLKFREWWKKKKKFKNLYLPDDWPNPVVRDAYYHPAIDESREPFSWALPDIEGLRRYLQDELGWAGDKVDQTLLPIVRRVGQRGQANAINRQSNLNGFFDISAGAGSYAPRQRQTYASKRLQKVVADFRKGKAKGTEDGGDRSSSAEEGGSSTSFRAARGKAKGKHGLTTKKPAKRVGRKKRKTKDVAEDEELSDRSDSAAEDTADMRAAALNLRPRRQATRTTKSSNSKGVDDGSKMDGIEKSSDDAAPNAGSRKRKM
ncbi:DNA repair protein rad2 [Tulasnella sp. 403]|nr:DNA repair protein rad2 [Tulasnella sp. 403]